MSLARGVMNVPEMASPWPPVGAQRVKTTPEPSGAKITIGKVSSTVSKGRAWPPADGTCQIVNFVNLLVSVSLGAAIKKALESCVQTPEGITDPGTPLAG